MSSPATAASNSPPQQTPTGLSGRVGSRLRVQRATLPAVFLTALLTTALSGCASTDVLRSGQRAESQDDYDRAVIEYTRALQSRPNDRRLRKALERAKLRAAEDHFGRGRRLTALGRHEEALVEYQMAFELNPSSGDIDKQLRETRRKVQTKVKLLREGQTELEALIDRARDLAPPGLDLPQDIELPDSLVFRSTCSRDIFSALGKFANINIIFDPTFRDTSLSVDLRNASLKDALDSVAAATCNFYRVGTSQTVTIIPDTPAKRREYEEEVVQTFFLSNADLAETIELLRLVIDLRRLAPVNATRAISIKDTPERVAAAAKLIKAIDKARPEVIIDVELLEVNRSTLIDYGLQFASPGSPGIDGQLDVNRPLLTLEDLQNVTAADVFVANVPGLFYRLLKSDANTRILANPRLRTSEGLSAQARFGERVPVPVSTFVPIAQGGVAQQPITSFNYENIGVNIDISPQKHHDNDVSLTLNVEISNISGTGYGDLPTFGNRSITTTIRLRDGETNILAGLIRDDERDTLAGVPGLSDLPLIGRLFARNTRETQETDIILTLTPHIIRVLDLTEEDLRPFRVGRDASSPLLDLPAPPPPPLELQPPAPQQQLPVPPDVPPRRPCTDPAACSVRPVSSAAHQSSSTATCAPSDRRRSTKCP